MKKILIGLLQTTSSPFIIILGQYVISKFNAPDGAMFFALFLGGGSVLLNWMIGIMLIIKGYGETKAFEGW